MKSTSELTDTALALYLSGKTYVEIAKTLGVTKGQIKYHMKKRLGKGNPLLRGRRKKALDESYFDTVDNQNKAYILGFAAADGSVTTREIGGYVLNIVIQDRDIEILEFIKTQLKYEGTIKPSFIKTKGGEIFPYQRLTVSSRQLIKSLIEKGVKPNKTYKSEIPKIPENMFRHYLRGFFDGDGCTYLHHTTPTYAVSMLVEDSCAKEFQRLIKEGCGVTFRIKQASRTNVVKKMVVTSFSDINKFLTWIYEGADFFLKRKYQKFLDIIDRHSKTHKKLRRGYTVDQIKQARELSSKGFSVREISNILNIEYKQSLRTAISGKTYKDLT